MMVLWKLYSRTEWSNYLGHVYVYAFFYCGFKPAPLHWVILWFIKCTLIYLVLDKVVASFFNRMRIVNRPYWSRCCMSSKSIDSIKAQNNFRCLAMSSCLLAGQFLCLLIWCFRGSRCVLVLVQWNKRWSTVWSPWPQIHFASSRRLKRWRYALVFPCPDSTAASFGVKLMFIHSLSRTDGKYCFVAAALWHVVHSACYFCLSSSAASWYRVLLGILLNS